MKRQNVRTLSLIVCTLTYLFVGAAVFDALESETELKQRHQVQLLRKSLQHKYNITDSDYTILESIIVKSIPHKAGHQWKFSGAFYFATTVITTIGYGHSCPMTIGGKIFCMFYALAGIPLGLVMFQSIGERMNTVAAKILRCCKSFFGRRPVVTHIDLIIICSGLSMFLMAAGAWIFHYYEEWSYFDSLYYCFITLVTIGFGDYVALQKDGALQNRPEYVIFSLVFIVFGLTVISAAMNLLVLRFLTLNTEDEKRDQREAKLAAKGLATINSLEGRRTYSQKSHSDSDNTTTNSSSTDSAANSDADADTGRERTPRRKRRSRGRQRITLGSADAADTASINSCSCYQLGRLSEGDQRHTQPHSHRRREEKPADTMATDYGRNTDLDINPVNPFRNFKSSATADSGPSPFRNFGGSSSSSARVEELNPFRDFRSHAADASRGEVNPFRSSAASREVNPFRSISRPSAHAPPAPIVTAPAEAGGGGEVLRQTKF